MTEPQPTTAPPPAERRIALPVSRPVAAYVLLAVNVALFAVPYLASAVTGSDLYELTLLWGQKDNAAIFSGGEYYRLVTAMFLHGGVAHILFNGWALYSIGPETERMYGTLRFLAVYLLGGLAGSLASYALTRAPSVGASGAIFGMIGAQAAFYYTSRDLLREQSRQALGGLVTVIAINLLIGFQPGSRIDNFAHLGGLVGGALAGWLLAPRLKLVLTGQEPRIERQFLAARVAGGRGAAGAAGAGGGAGAAAAVRPKTTTETPRPLRTHRGLNTFFGPAPCVLWSFESLW